MNTTIFFIWREALRTLALLLMLLMISPCVSPALSAEQRILLSHNAPEKVEAGSTVIIQLQFTDENGVPIELDTVSVEMTDPFGFKKTVSLDKAGTGRYMFTWTFSIEGAYYLTGRANKYGYISYSSTFLINAVKSKAYLEWLWAFLNSPSFFLFVIMPISAFLIWLILTGILAAAILFFKNI